MPPCHSRDRNVQGTNACSRILRDLGHFKRATPGTFEDAMIETIREE